MQAVLALADSFDRLARAAARPEVARRRELAKLGAGISQLSDDFSRLLRAVEVLEAIGSPQAQKQLERLACGAAGFEETEDAKAALVRVRKLQK